MNRNQRRQRAQRQTWRDGYYARRGAAPVGACPHPEGRLAAAWLHGWDCADRWADHRL